MKWAEQIKDKLFRQWLLWQTRPARIDRELARLTADTSGWQRGREGPGIGRPDDALIAQTRPETGGVVGPGAVTGQLQPGSPATQVTVAAVQGELRLVTRVEDYVRQMFGYTQEAARQGAQLAAFPEDNAAHLLGLLPGIGRLDPQQDLAGAIKNLTGDSVAVADIFRYLEPVTNQVFYHTFSRLARLFNLYIMPGSVIVSDPDEPGKMVNQACLYDPQGQQVGRQTKTHLLPLEKVWGLSCGRELSIYPTTLGRVAFPVCMDASFFESFRILSLLGAEIIMLPVANPEEYNYYKALRGIWPRVQENAVYGVKSALVGKAFGLTLTGKTGIYGPLELTPGRDGIIAESESYDREEVVVAKLELEKLRGMREAEEHETRFNGDLYRKFFPRVYREFARENPPHYNK